MPVTQYIGARYVPLFAEPLEWSSATAYEPLTIVYYQGNSYTSKQAVPAGLAAPSDESVAAYWAITGNYNAQIEQYRLEVQAFDGRITTNAGDIDTLEGVLPLADFDSTNTVSAAIDSVSDAVTAETTARQAADSALHTTITQETNAAIAQAISGIKRTFLFFGDSWGAPNNDSQSYAARDNASPFVDKIIYPQNSEHYNFCDGGAGWADTSSNLYNTNFAGQVPIAAADTRFANAEVTDIFCFGGLNDVGTNYSISQIKSGVTSFITAAQAAFPNANITILGTNIRRAGNAAFYANLRNATYAIGKVATDYKITFIPTASWLLCDPVSWSSDNYHPNNHGGNVLAGFFTSLINGKMPSFLIEIPFKEVRVGNTAYDSTAAFDSTISFDMVSGIVSGGYARNFTIPLAANALTTIVFAGDGDSPFVFNALPVAGYTQASITDYLERGKFTGLQAGNYTELRITTILAGTGTAGNITRVDAMVSGRVF